MSNYVFGYRYEYDMNDIKFKKFCYWMLIGWFSLLLYEGLDNLNIILGRKLNYNIVNVMKIEE